MNGNYIVREPNAKGRDYAPTTYFKRWVFEPMMPEISNDRPEAKVFTNRADAERVVAGLNRSPFGRWEVASTLEGGL